MLQPYILAEIKSIEQKLAKIRNEKQETLKIQVINNRPFYYKQYKDKSGKIIREYIAKEQMQYIKQLAQQAYDQKIKAKLEKNLKALRSFDEKTITDIYDHMTQHRKALVEPYRIGVKEMIRRWENESYEKYTDYMDSLRFETDRGEMVRSKSEVIIANMLYRQKESLSYKYERPLILENRGKKYTLHPDFTVLNLKTGRIVYWEHMGRMDDSKYAADFVWKANLYLLNGYTMGGNVIYTYETSNHPLDIRVVKKIIQEIRGEQEVRR